MAMHRCFTPHRQGMGADHTTLDLQQAAWFMKDDVQYTPHPAASTQLSLLGVNWLRQSLLPALHRLAW